MLHELWSIVRLRPNAVSTGATDTQMDVTPQSPQFRALRGWMAQCAELLDPLYQSMKKELLNSKVIGTDDTSVKVLDRKLPFARNGRIWPYLGDAHHPVIVYDYTPTRSRAGPAKFLEGYKGYLQADAYSVYDAFFKPQRGMTEVGCWMHYPDSSFIRSECAQPAGNSVRVCSC